MTKYQLFLRIADSLNSQLGVIPLLFGSLGLQQRLGVNLQADDIDILVPACWLEQGWDSLISVMESLGYTLYDLHEHAFAWEGISVAFAALESLESFAGINYNNISQVTDGSVSYLLLELEDYLRVYTASARDGYRADKKHKNDSAKIALIRHGLGER